MHAKLLQSCPTFCDPVGCSPPGFSDHGILQVKILEWVTIPFSKGSSRPRDQTHVSCSSYIGRWVLYPLSHQGSPLLWNLCCGWLGAGGTIKPGAVWGFFLAEKWIRQVELGRERGYRASVGWWDVNSWEENFGWKENAAGF